MDDDRYELDGDGSDNRRQDDPDQVSNERGGGRGGGSSSRSGQGSSGGSRSGQSGGSGSGRGDGRSSSVSNARFNPIDRDYPGHHEYDSPDRPGSSRRNPTRNERPRLDEMYPGETPIIYNHITNDPREHGGRDYYDHPRDRDSWRDPWGPRYRFAHDHMPGSGEHDWPQYHPWRIQNERVPRYRSGDYGMYAAPPWQEAFEGPWSGEYGNPSRNSSNNPGRGSGRSNSPQGSEGSNMSGDTEKVSVNLGAGGFGPLTGGYGGGHSDGGANAALLALLAMGQNGGRDRDHYCGDGFGLGGGGLGALVLLAALGGGGIGGFGRGHGDHVNVDCGRRGGRDFDGDPFVLSKLGSIEGAIPLAASQIQNGILESTAGITNTINQTGLAQLAATSGVKDAVQNSATAILQNASANTQSVLTAICTLSAKIDQNTILDLQRQLGVAEADACEERNSRRTREVEVNVTQQVNQQQAQAQLQRIEDDRFNRLFANLSAFIGNQAMFARQGQDVINFGGTMTASGTQAAANTQVR